MNRLIELENAYINSLKKIYSKEESKSIFKFIVENSLSISMTKLLLEKDNLTSRYSRKILSFLCDLKKGKPPQYVLGFKSFYNCKIHVNENVLIPRNETEELVDLALKYIKPGQKILDVGTGSGCIAISLAKHSNCRAIGIDISSKALSLARQNSIINNVSVSFIRFDIMKDDIKKIEKQNVIISNPPYLTSLEKKHLHKNVLLFEPERALFVKNNNPLFFYKKIVSIAKKKLFKEGFLFFEINEKFSKEVFFLLKENYFKNIEIKKDINGKDRLAKAQFM